ncbi:hypothetical protein ASE01_21300 [Nocardioides sp. Root190]|uniref:MFS transporter n=1 Tax=Nocardioides sp. Root190 TaxID=1736488 RepID=UPI0006F3D98F|nr:MFS transporter [Nocardioides sp. Root190]KRB73284.1 hypothetical protein ASE01_21300 [Nocardioides sp. Root190]
MTGVPDAGSLRLLLSGPAVARTFVLALLGRLAYGVLPLCLFFTVRHATDSFALAAGCSAAVGFASLVMPAQARLIDRCGQHRVLPVAAAAYSSLLVLGAVIAQVSLPPAAWLGYGVLLGLTGPVLGPSMRAQWREIAPEGVQRQRAYSLDAVCEESLYLLGPLVAGLVLTSGPAWLGLLVAAGLVWCGVAGLVLSPYRPEAVAPAPHPAEVSRRAGLPPGVAALLGTGALFGAGGAVAFVAIAALADDLGRPAVAALVETGMAVGAVLGGLLWARSRRQRSAGPVLAGLLVIVALAQVAASVAVPQPVLVGLALAMGALATSPVFVVAFTLADTLVPPERRTEMSTWVTVGINGGAAIGTALAGLVVPHGIGTAFLLAALLSTVAAGCSGIMGPWPSTSPTTRTPTSS